MPPVTCPTCGKTVNPTKGYRCPECQHFLHPDPIKRQEAELAERFREFLLRIPYEEWAQPLHVPPPSPDALATMPQEQLIEQVRHILGEKGPYLFEIMVIDLTSDLLPALFDQFVDTRFAESYLDTIGVTFGIKHFEVGDSQITSRIWFLSNRSLDPPRSLHKRFYKGASGAIFLYDRTQEASFTRLPNLIEGFDQAVRKGVPRVVLGYEPETEVTWAPTPQALQKLIDRYHLTSYEVYLGKPREIPVVLNQIFHQLIHDRLKSYTPTP
jgi:hypothetical protein